MTAASVIRQVRQAAKLLEPGARIPPLRLSPDDLAAVGVPEQDVEAILAGSAREQVRLLHPHVERHLRRQKASKVEKARKLAQRHADELSGSARRVEEGVEILPEHLAAIASVAAINTVQLVDTAPVVLPRLLLRRVMAALRGCQVRAVVEHLGLRLTYRTGTGSGEIHLVGGHAPRAEILLVDLHEVGRPLVARQAAPTNGRQHKTPTRPSTLTRKDPGLLPEPQPRTPAHQEREGGTRP